MKTPKVVQVSHKKLNSGSLKKRKTREDSKEKKNRKITSDAPKRPPGPFFVFLQDFRKTFKENFPDNKSISAVGKAAGDKWKAMSESEKAPYMASALNKKGEYEKALEAYTKKSNGVKQMDDEKPEESTEKSTSEVRDDADQDSS